MQKIYLFSLIFPFILFSSEIKPFATDGCTAFPNGSLQKQNLWLECCIQHDLAYWKGGTLREKNKADEQLKGCVEKLGKEKTAILMKLGVDLGGSAYFPTPFRWAYGWPYMRGYKPLNTTEKEAVRTQLKRFENLIRVFSKEVNLKKGKMP